MNEPQSAPYRHLRGPGALCQPPEIPAPAAPWRGPRDRILSFLYKWEDGSAQGLEAESFFTGEEKLNEKTRSLGSPFRRARQEAAPSTRMERLREVKRLSQATQRVAGPGGRVPDLQGGRKAGSESDGRGEGGSKTCRAGVKAGPGPAGRGRRRVPDLQGGVKADPGPAGRGEG